MSNIEYYTTDMRWGARAGIVTLHDRLERGRERSQPDERFGVHLRHDRDGREPRAGIRHHARSEPTRSRVRSHQRAAAAWAAGQVRRRSRARARSRSSKGDPLRLQARRGHSARHDAWRRLAKLQAAHEGRHRTAGNASQQNDAAAACLVVAEDKLAALGLEPMAFLVGWAAAGCDPATMGIGPVPAVSKLFAAHGPAASTQIDLVELNEAFACQVLAVLQGLGLGTICETG